MSKPAAGTPIDTGAAISASLTASWIFAEGSGSTYADDAGGHAGAAGASTPTWDASGIVCTGGQAAVLPVTGITDAGAWTFRLRFNANSWSASYPAMVDTADRSLSIFVPSGSGFAAGSIVTAMSGVSVPSGSIQDLLITAHYRASGDFSVPQWDTVAYLNGTSVGSASLFTSIPAVATLHLGDNPSGGGSGYEGEYELCQWWNRELSSAEATSLYASPYSMYSSGPVGRFRRMGMTGGINAGGFVDGGINA